MSTVLSRLHSWHRPLMVMVSAMAALSIVSGIGLFVDDRWLLDESVWLKPFKFAIAFVIYGATLAWLIPKLHKGKRLMWWMGTIFAATGIIDVAFIAMQAARGTFSHFIVPDEADTVSTVGNWFFATGLPGLFITSVVMAVLLLRQRIGDGPLTWALRIGIGVAAVGMGLGYAIVFSQVDGEPRTLTDANGQAQSMIGQHGIGAPDGSGMPLTNWSVEGGDMRVPHFFGLHAIQVLLVAVLVLSFAAGRVMWLREERVRTQLLLSVAGGYSAFVTLTTWQAVRGQSLIHPDALTWTALAVIVTAFALATAVIVARARRAVAGASREREPVSF